MYHLPLINLWQNKDKSCFKMRKRLCDFLCILIVSVLHTFTQYRQIVISDMAIVSTSTRFQVSRKNSLIKYITIDYSSGCFQCSSYHNHKDFFRNTLKRNFYYKKIINFKSPVGYLKNIINFESFV